MGEGIAWSPTLSNTGMGGRYAPAETAVVIGKIAFEFLLLR
jgi:hypothetical protein